MKEIEFYYDILSPYSFLAYERLVKIIQRDGRLKMVMKPCLLGGIMKGSGNTPPGLVPAKLTWMLKDLERGFNEFNIKIKLPRNFPARTLPAMRLLTALDGTELQEPLAKELWSRYWKHDQDISSDEIQIAALKECNVSSERIQELMKRRSDPEIKSLLSRNTQRVLDHGGFGVPVFMVQKELFYGSDRIQQMIKLSCNL